LGKRLERSLDEGKEAKTKQIRTLYATTAKSQVIRRSTVGLKVEERKDKVLAKRKQRKMKQQ